MKVRGWGGRMLKFRDPVYKGNFRVFISPFGRVRHHLRTHGFPREAETERPLAAMTMMCENDLGQHEVILWFQNGWRGRTPEELSLLAHEALHACWFILRARKLPAEIMADEVANYYLEWLVREILVRAWKWRPARKRRRSTRKKR